jgi:membrane protein implicated in regulation of membrane protease activity
MNLTPKEMVAVVAVGALGAGLLAAVLLDSWRWSIALLGALSLLFAAVIVLALKRQDTIRTGDLERIERKIDNLALRVVTESQATHRELSGLIEELGSTLQRSETPRT